MRISDGSSDVCSSDLDLLEELGLPTQITAEALKGFNDVLDQLPPGHVALTLRFESDRVLFMADGRVLYEMTRADARSEEHPSTLQSLMRIAYAVFRLKNKNPQYVLIPHPHYTDQ